jgi:hypothetical protein
MVVQARPQQVSVCMFPEFLHSEARDHLSDLWHRADRPGGTCVGVCRGRLPSLSIEALEEKLGEVESCGSRVGGVANYAKAVKY